VFREFADALPLMLWTAKADGFIDYYNEHWHEQTGLPKEKLGDEGWKSVIHPNDIQRFRDAWYRAIGTGECCEIQIRLRSRATGKDAWHLVRAAPVLDKAGRLIRWCGTCTDIDELKHSVEALQRVENGFRGMVQAANEGIWTLDEKARISFINPRMAQMLGYEDGEILGRLKWDLLFEEDKTPAKLLFERRRQGFHDQADIRFRRKDGSILWTIMAARPLFDESGEFRGALDLFTDITDRKNAEREIVQLNETLERRVADRTAELEKANRAIVASSLELKAARDEAIAASDAKSRFLANISHEVRTPIVAVLGYADMLLNPDLDRADRDHALQAIRRNGTHLLQVINDVLDLSKIEAGRMELESIRYSPWQLLLEVVSTVRLQAERDGISLEVQPTGRLPAFAEMDTTRVRQILMNLVSNAIKFSKPGGRVSLRIGVCRPQPSRVLTLVIEVEDRGIGMTPAQIEQLFTPFQQADSSTTRRFGGTGLGLSITRRLTEAMNGEMTVRSLYGQGSCFSVAIPLSSVDEHVAWFGVAELERHAAIECKPDQNGDLPALTGRVLLAEDSLDNQRVIIYHLRRMGLEIDTAENGKLAVEKALTDRFDLILMDMQMPELDGYGATSSLRCAGYLGPIIAFTAHAMKEDREKCLRAGCTDYVTKPVEAGALARTVERYLKAPVVGSRVDRDRIEPSANQEPILSEFWRSPGMETLVREYVDSLPEKVARFRMHLAVGDGVQLQALAHQISGHGGMYGYSCLTETAALIEQAVREARGERVIGELVEVFANLCSRIESGLSRPRRSRR
jgi:PAS domain S-box-containing protein